MIIIVVLYTQRFQYIIFHITRNRLATTIHKYKFVLNEAPFALFTVPVIDPNLLHARAQGSNVKLCLYYVHGVRVKLYLY